MKFGQLLESLGEKLGIEIEDAGGAAAVDVDGQTVILQLAGGFDGDILLMRAEIGTLPDEGRGAIAKAALAANHLYQGTGGATLSIDEARSALHLQRYDWLDRLDEDMVLERLLRFVDTAEEWRRVLIDFSLARGQEGRLDSDRGAGGKDAIIV